MGKKEKAEKKERPLEKMTAKELRDLALTIPEIVGVHGMNKEEVISAIKKSRGIKEEKKTTRSMRELKEKIKELRGQKIDVQEKKDRKAVDRLRKRISRLKKQARQAA
ncbi:MAG TPA: transcription termination factor Rho [Thermodesulfobacteriota bacterium]|nr:transcription termination factor Rho [Thermodesulfobacteriota bacterium]